jgi:hypothetical protein
MFAFDITLIVIDAIERLPEKSAADSHSLYR